MARTDASKLEMIAFIVDIQVRNNEDDDGDKYLSSADYAMEAIEAVLDDRDSSILRQFLDSAS